MGVGQLAPIVSSRIVSLKKDLHEITQQPDFDTNENLRISETILASELEHIEKTQARDKKDHLRAEIATHGEKLGGVWSAINKEKKPRDLIRRLIVPESNPPRYERSSTKMAQLARDYHENLQQSDPVHPDPEEHLLHLNRVLDEIPDDQKLPDPNRTEM